MKITEYITNSIDRLPKGYVFTYADFMSKVKNIEAKRKSRPVGREAIIKALNRMAASGKIAKLSKGKFYKPEKSAFGKLQPNRYQIVKDLLEEDGKIIGYLTGYSIYNQLGLTTQISNIIQIGKNTVRPSFKRGEYKISFVLQKNTITKDNIPLLQILDAIRYIKKIPDTTISSACKRLKEIIKDLSKENKISLVRLALKYPPAARALLGAILEEIGNRSLTEPLLKSLNPITTYNLPGAEKVLTFLDKWNIK
ncbi:MAG: DUF6088 family protein [Ignavibacteriales bacterium]|nr:hypothetical protein [Ignavibacterium sp.]MCZ2268088.1 DUF6088 family protein [Ignavibacteriales bacterium]